MTMEGGELSFERDAPVPHIVHPMRVAIVEAMRWIGRPLSAAELTRVIDDDELGLSQIAYQVRKLAQAGVIEPVRERHVRASIETFYFFPPWQ